MRDEIFTFESFMNWRRDLISLSCGTRTAVVCIGTLPLLRTDCFFSSFFCFFFFSVVSFHYFWYQLLWWIKILNRDGQPRRAQGLWNFRSPSFRLLEQPLGTWRCHRGHVIRRWMSQPVHEMSLLTTLWWLPAADGHHQYDVIEGDHAEKRTNVSDLCQSSVTVFMQFTTTGGHWVDVYVRPLNTAIYYYCPQAWPIYIYEHYNKKQEKSLSLSLKHYSELNIS